MVSPHEKLHATLKMRCVRVELADLSRLADFLQLETNTSKIAVAGTALSLHLSAFPVLVEVLSCWSTLRKVRGSGPEHVQDWIDAVAVIEYMQRNQEAKADELPIREVSARLFKDSKRIERITAQLDVLLSGSIESEVRQSSDVWREIGLGREEQPVRMAGAVVIRRTRLTSILDEPYAGFPASSVLGVEGHPDYVLTIENQTTFHTEAKRRCMENVLLIYTAGMPSPSWCAMYERLLSSISADVPIRHWGDVDEGGFRIAAYIASTAANAGRTLSPYRMSPDDVPEGARVKADDGKAARMGDFAKKAGWYELAAAILDLKFTAEQESLG
ncbi:DUF2399 domain-containing protein [Paraburkholderia bengalensis]|uniref:DUF2399 domain-containing protein n=1 Tax=Paraburkholderia bengalensis TaxID=2747562 RepID=A0ABU8IL34_9BURK